MSSERERREERARQGRVASLVIAFTGALWVVAVWAGNHWDWPQRYRALADLAALGGFVFALILTWRLWKSGRKDEG
ncbi:MAG: hypothetical protein D6686_07430 [Alphaproteobacteria bacterium]|nr:MAG: hypothetical protein D6686_07430 [Alphaproteobacteria bacterium]